ncbi:hypothetical protein C8Q75DRAFT_356625 [Abortiporus biennis]|nr:hypothetical protein C8Q75DRAFT_356625 [Abortiporus biennis]
MTLFTTSQCNTHSHLAYHLPHSNPYRCFLPTSGPTHRTSNHLIYPLPAFLSFSYRSLSHSSFILIVFNFLPGFCSLLLLVVLSTHIVLMPSCFSSIRKPFDFFLFYLKPYHFRYFFPWQCFLLLCCALSMGPAGLASYPSVLVPTLNQNVR